MNDFIAFHHSALVMAIYRSGHASTVNRESRHCAARLTVITFGSSARIPSHLAIKKMLASWFSRSAPRRVARQSTYRLHDVHCIGMMPPVSCRLHGHHIFALSRMAELIHITMRCVI
jgi:hypothetical protein